ncbi:MAG: glycosyltransferase family 4 protein [Thermoprotei archaeon]
MKTLIPFYNVNDLDFYFHLVYSLYKYDQEIFIIYVNGVPSDSWRKNFYFKKVKLLNIMQSKSLGFFFSRKKIIQQLGNIDIDTIFVLSDLWALEFSAYFSEKLNIPFIVWYRGDHREIRKIRKVNLIKRLVTNYMEIKYLDKASFIIPNCLKLYEKLKAWGVNENKITKPIYNGVDTEFFRPMKVSRSDRFTIAYAGRISPEKRFNEFLKIIKELNDIRFIVAGSNNLNIKFPSNIEYFGKLPFNKMPEFYNMADLIVLPSITEGFPSVILEAYACEKPVLVTKEAFPKELKVFGAIADINEFKQKIRELQKSDLKIIGENAREYVKKYFTWENFGKNIVEYLKKASNSD